MAAGGGGSDDWSVVSDGTEEELERCERDAMHATMMGTLGSAIQFLNAMESSAKRDAIRAEMRDIARLAIKAHKIGHFDESCHAILQKLASERRIYEEAIGHVKESKKAAYYLVTVNPKPETELKEFCKKVNKCMSKKWLEEVYLTFEQRSTDGSGDGMHIHFLFPNPDKPPSAVHREVYNTFKDLVGNTKHVDVRGVPQTQYSRTLSYVLGDKTDESKLEKVSGDKIWRSRVGLLPTYTDDNFPIDLEKISP